jgi:hypothetical protein
MGIASMRANGSTERRALTILANVVAGFARARLIAASTTIEHAGNLAPYHPARAIDQPPERIARPRSVPSRPEEQSGRSLGAPRAVLQNRQFAFADRQINRKGQMKKRHSTKRQAAKSIQSDTGPKERHHHGDAIELEETIQAGIRRARNRSQTILDRYLLRWQISERQYDAGNKIYRQWRASVSQVSVTGRYGPRLGHSPEKSEYQIDMRRRVDLAMREVGSQLSAVVVHVCLCDLPARDWAINAGGAPQAGIVVLRLALDALADHYEKSKKGGRSDDDLRKVTALEK